MYLYIVYVYYASVYCNQVLYLPIGVGPSVLVKTSCRLRCCCGLWCHVDKFSDVLYVCSFYTLNTPPLNLIPVSISAHILVFWNNDTFFVQFTGCTKQQVCVLFSVIWPSLLRVGWFFFYSFRLIKFTRPSLFSRRPNRYWTLGVISLMTHWR